MNVQKNIHLNFILLSHTGDTGIDQADDYYTTRGARYSLSDMITQIKRSIPDLRSVKHQPLENKESPLGSPNHHRYTIESQQSHASDHHHHHHHYPAGNIEAAGRTSFEKETDAITLSAIQTTSCTCGSKNAATDIPVIVDKASPSSTSDDLEGLTVPHSSIQMKSAPAEIR